MMLNALCVCFGGFFGNAKGQKKIDDQPVPGAHPASQSLAGVGEKHAAIRPPGDQSLTLEASNGFNGRGV